MQELQTIPLQIEDENVLVLWRSVSKQLHRDSLHWRNFSKAQQLQTSEDLKLQLTVEVWEEQMQRLGGRYTYRVLQT